MSTLADRVESLLRSHPAVADATVTGATVTGATVTGATVTDATVTDATMTADAAALLKSALRSDSTVVVAPVSFLSGPEVRELLRAVLPAGEVPARVAIVGALPRQSDGSLDHGQLQQALDTMGEAIYRFEPPRDELEHRVAALWREILDRDEVGATDDFLDVGGDSMSGVELVNRVDELFGVSVELDEVFQSTTVRGLAEAIRARQA